MDQCQSGGKLVTNFQRHWSIRIPPESHMDQWLPNLSESSGLHWHRSIECSSLPNATQDKALGVSRWAPFVQARKKSTKINFLGPETARWGGGLPRAGVGRRVRALPESFSSSSCLGRNLGCPENFAGISRTPGGLQKVCAKKFVRVCRSLVLQFPNAVVLNTVVRRSTQMSAKERKRAQTQVRKRAQKHARGRKRAQKSASA